MEHQATPRIALGAIFAVAGNRTLDVAHVNADLVLSACEDLQIDLRIATARLVDVVASHGKLALLGIAR